MEQYGLIGKPLGHSFSQQYFTEYFARMGRDACYLSFELDNITELPALIAAHPTLRGFNVTIPYKQQVIHYLDHLDEATAAIGAVNVVKIQREENNSRPLLLGYNTDHIGFRLSLQALLPGSCRNALLLGTGGASKAVDYALKELGISTTFVSRTPTSRQLGYADLSAHTIGDYDIIVNCTPLGMFPAEDTAPSIPYEGLHNRQYCYDLVYNPTQTLFLQRAAQQGCTVCNGLQMLHIQADESWKIWNAQ